MSAHQQVPVHNSEQLNNRSDSKDFLYRELLLWLWYRSEADQVFSLSPKTKRTLRHFADKLPDKFEVFVGDQISLEGASFASRQSLLKGGLPAQSKEAAVALVEGKSIRAMRVCFVVEGLGEIQLILDATQFTPKSVRFPQPTESQNDQQHQPSQNELNSTARELRLENHLQLVRFTSEIVNDLLSLFLAERTSQQWDQTTLKDIKKWALQRLTKSSKNAVYSTIEAAVETEHNVH